MINIIITINVINACCKKGRKEKKGKKLTCGILVSHGNATENKLFFGQKNNNNKEGYTFSMWEIHILYIYILIYIFDVILERNSINCLFVFSFFLV